MIKLLTALFIILIIFRSSHLENTESKFKTGSDGVTELPWMSDEPFRKFLIDHRNKIHDDFSISPFFYPSVFFWFLIYTQFDSNQVVIHDKNDLRIIYKVLDFTELRQKGLNKNSLYILQQKIAEEQIQKLLIGLKKLSANPFDLSFDAKNILQILKKRSIQAPIRLNDRKVFFRSLLENIRTQTGQKNFIRDGIVRSLPYQKFLDDYFKGHQLPKELLAIPFLESSFNPQAESKVGALGIWQFMPLIASYYMPKRSEKPKFDYRQNIGISSISAAFLMKENFQLLKKWDLAVTAYNSGTKHIIDFRRKINTSTKDLNLEKIIRNSDSDNFGFASKNFYTEFLALVHTLAYQDDLFDDLHDNERQNHQAPLKFFLTKCQIKLDKTLGPDLLDDVLFHNHHLPQGVGVIPKGFILSSKMILPKNKFLLVNPLDDISIKPKMWLTKLERQSCSTK